MRRWDTKPDRDEYQCSECGRIRQGQPESLGMCFVCWQCAWDIEAEARADQLLGLPVPFALDVDWSLAMRMRGWAAEHPEGEPIPLAEVLALVGLWLDFEPEMQQRLMAVKRAVEAGYYK